VVRLLKELKKIEKGKSLNEEGRELTIVVDFGDTEERFS